MTTLSYETAKKLKAAGFPQSGEGRLVPDKEDVSVYDAHDPTFVSSTPVSTATYYPTLSELIEACVDKMSGDFHLVNWGVNWICGDYSGYVQDWVTYRCEAPTSEEAVSNLFIAIHTSEGG